MVFLEPSVLYTSLIGALVILLGWHLIQKRYRDAQLASLGAKPVQVPSRLPLGVDLLWETVTYNERNANIELFEKYADMTKSRTYQVYPIGDSTDEKMSLLGMNHIMTFEPENVKSILATQFNDFAKGKDFHDSWYQFLGDGIFVVNGEMWQESRALLRPQFHKERVSDLLTFEQHISKMISLLPKDGQTFDISDYWHRFTLDASTEYLFGKSVDSLDNPKVGFAKAFADLQHIYFIRFRLFALWWLYTPKNLKPSLDILNQFVEPFVERAIAGRQKTLTEKDEDRSESQNFTEALSEFTADRKVLRDQLVNTLLAARDTTAAGLSWLFYELSYHPEKYAKLRDEVLNVLGTTRTPTYAELKRMKYMQWCMNEVLRLYPLIPFNGRTALKDTTLPRGGGPDGLSPIAVQKGTLCNYCPFIIQRDTEIFGPDANEFKPERWEDWFPTPWTYIPFNGGPRICLGQNFALTEISYATARMCQSFVSIEERSGMPRGSQGYKTDIILTPLLGVKVGLISADTVA